MKTTVPLTMSLGVINRWDNTVIESVPFPDDENPHLLPHDGTFIWHYMRFEYFKTLLERRFLHLTRIDDQSDMFDGQYSAMNAKQMTPIMHQLAIKSGIIKMENGTAFFPTNANLRRKTFIHCWAMGKNDCPWMWSTCLANTHRAIAIRTTIGRLRNALGGTPIEMGRIIYYSNAKPRPDWSYTAPFWAKDMQFKRERELRLAHTLAIDDNTEAEFMLAPLDLTAFLKIVVHPSCEDGFVEEVRAVLTKFDVHIPVRNSQLRPIDLKPFQSSAIH
jgi:hypothetical protein